MELDDSDIACILAGLQRMTNNLKNPDDIARYQAVRDKIEAGYAAASCPTVLAWNRFYLSGLSRIHEEELVNHG